MVFGSLFHEVTAPSAWYYSTGRELRQTDANASCADTYITGVQHEVLLGLALKYKVSYAKGKCAK